LGFGGLVSALCYFDSFRFGFCSRRGIGVVFATAISADKQCIADKTKDNKAVFHLDKKVNFIHKVNPLFPNAEKRFMKVRFDLMKVGFGFVKGRQDACSMNKRKH
jgi:hypothetical protein